ncbi:MAG: heme-binding protein [Alphaproteobacteria bacterium]|nr:heme-binding protein [Alphaproteobacteria bacterium]
MSGARIALLASFLVCGPAWGQALVTYKSLGPELALEIGRSTLEACRAAGYQVAVGVVDRFGTPLVMLRDRFAGPHTPDTATRKAWTAVSFRTNTTELVAMARPGTPQDGVRNVAGAIIIGGGVLVEAGGGIVGAIGVSGAPGGDADEACAKAALEKFRDRLEFD